MPGLGKKSRSRVRETKVYINEMIYDQIKARYFFHKRSDFHYGYMNTLINDCLREYLERIKANPAYIDERKEMAGIKAGASETALNKLFGHLLHEVLPLLDRYKSKANTPLLAVSNLTPEDAERLETAALALRRIMQAALAEIEISPAADQPRVAADLRT